MAYPTETAAQRAARDRFEAREYDKALARTRDSAKGPAIRRGDDEDFGPARRPRKTHPVRKGAEVVATEAIGGGPADPVADAAAAGEIAGGARRRRQQQDTGSQLGRYQGILLAEYVACLLLTAATPIATKDESDGLSPYEGADIVKLSSITLLYTLLGLLSVGGRGAARFAAWFGGLILITDGLYEASNIAKDFGLFTGQLAGFEASNTPPAVPAGQAAAQAPASAWRGVQNVGAAPTESGA